MPTVHSREYELIFSLNKQSDIETAITAANIQYQRSLRTFAPFREEHQNVTDREWYGKGHSHPTFVDTLQKRYLIDSQDRSATNLELLQALALVMGNVVSIQPDSATNPSHWRHTLTWQDLSTNKEVLYTSFIEKMGSEYSKLLSGAWLSSLTLTVNRDDHIVLGYEGGGRKYADIVKVSPGITAAVFFKTLFGTVSFGAADAPADISAEVLSANLTISQNPDILHLMGNPSGDERLVSEVLIGDQTVSGSVVIKINATHRDRFLDEDTVELVLTLSSQDEIFTGQKHTCAITLHNFRIADEAFGEEGQTVSYTLNFGEDTVMKVGADEQLTVVMDTNIDNTELLVAA